MLSYNIYCRASKRDRQGLSPIEININDGVRRVVIVSDFKYDALKFERERRARKSNRAKEIVATLMDEVTDRIIELKKNGIDVTPANIKRYFQGVPGADVYMLRDAYLEGMRHDVGEGVTFGTYNKYVMVLGLVCGLDKKLVDITPSDINGIVSMWRRKYKESTLSNYMTRLKAVFDFAVRKRWIETNPCQFKIKKIEADVETITFEEFVRIKNKKLAGVRMNKIRDAFVFICSSGLSYCDFVSFDYSKVVERDGKYVYVGNRGKTGVEFYSYLLPDAIEILKRYDYDLSSLYLSNQKMNSYLKELADICGINLNLTCHRGRHYYARNLLLNNVPVEIISRCCGHTNVRITTHYLQLFREQKLDFVMNGINL